MAYSLRGEYIVKIQLGKCNTQVFTEEKNLARWEWGEVMDDISKDFREEITYYVPGK